MFCRRHRLAPPAQRGGWLSADRRRRKFAASATQPLNASRIAQRLWMGGEPPFDRDLPDFDLLVLCARELQPEHVAFEGIVARCPIPDDALTTHQLRLVIGAARYSAEQISKGGRVLVTCAAGRNRSGLVVALALSQLTRMSAQEITGLIRDRRSPDCLSNPHFQGLLRTFVGDGRR